MGRWAPDAQGRLMQAALDLYLERGYEQTTVAEIAERAGLTERTFFRYFADKREVLFSGTSELRDFLLSRVTSAPDSDTPMQIVAAALCGTGTVFQGRRDHVLRRQAVVAANPELQERELIKLASLADSMADALEKRGVDPRAAGLAAQTGMAVFRIAFHAWVSGTDDPDLAACISRAFDDLRAVASVT